MNSNQSFLIKYSIKIKGKNKYAKWLMPCRSDQPTHIKVKRPPEEPWILSIHPSKRLRIQKYQINSVCDYINLLNVKSYRFLSTSWSRHSNFHTLSPCSFISFHHLKPTNIRPLTFFTTQKSRAAKKTVTTKIITKLLKKSAERT